MICEGALYKRLRCKRQLETRFLGGFIPLVLLWFLCQGEQTSAINLC